MVTAGQRTPNGEASQESLVTPGQRTPSGSKRNVGKRKSNHKKAGDGASRSALSSSSSGSSSGGMGGLGRTPGITPLISRPSSSGATVSDSGTNQWASGTKTCAQKISSQSGITYRQHLQKCTIVLRFLGNTGTPDYLQMLAGLNLPASEVLSIGPGEEGGGTPCTMSC